MTVTQNRYASALGATSTSDVRWPFKVSAPHHESLELHLLGDQPRFLPMHRDERAYHLMEINDVRPVTKYLYKFENSQQRPDPPERRAMCSCSWMPRMRGASRWHWRSSPTPPDRKPTI